MTTERRIERFRDLVARLHAHPRRRLTLLVGVDGPTGSGKTAFTSALSALDPEMALVPVSDFALARPAPDGGEIDWRRLRSQVLLTLGRDVPVRYERASGEWSELPVGGIVVVEGFTACMRQLVTFYDFRIWVESPGGVRSARLEAYVAEHDPAASAHLRVEGSGAQPHDPAREYVRVRG